MTSPRPPRIKPAKALPPEDLQRIEEYVRTAVPDKHKTATLRALTGQLGKAASVKLKCLSCCNFERDEVKNCAVITCPLNMFRPYQK